MKGKFSIVYAIVLVVLSFGAVPAQQTSYLPASAVDITQQIPSAPPNNYLSLFEQRGLMPYKGHTCGDESGAFEVDANEKQYGDNEYSIVRLHITHYKPAGKGTFDQFMKYTPPHAEAKKWEQEDKAATPPGKSRTVTNKEVVDGRMVAVNDLFVCSESKYLEYNLITFRSYAVVGTTFVRIDGSYNSKDTSLAEKIHSEIVEKVRKGSIK